MRDLAKVIGILVLVLSVAVIGAYAEKQRFTSIIKVDETQEKLNRIQRQLNRIEEKLDQLNLPPEIRVELREE